MMQRGLALWDPKMSENKITQNSMKEQKCRGKSKVIKELMTSVICQGVNWSLKDLSTSQQEHWKKP